MGLSVCFVLSIIVCLLFLANTTRFRRSDVQLGLQLLLVISVMWSLSELIILLVQDIDVVNFMYYVSSSVGLSTVVAWMYFASAYAGRDYHNGSLFSYIGISAYFLVILLKLTNPIHDSYFNIKTSDETLTFISVEYNVVHSLVTAVSYAVILFGLYLFYIGLQKRDVSYYSVAALVGSIVVPATVSIAIRSNILLPTLSGISVDSIGVSVFIVMTVAITSHTHAEFYEGSRDKFISDILDPSIVVDAESHEPLCYNDKFENIFLDSKVFDKQTDAIDECLLQDNKIVEIDNRFFTTKKFVYDYRKSADSIVIRFEDITEKQDMSETIVDQEDHIESISEGINHEIRNISQLIESKAVLSQTNQYEMDDIDDQLSDLSSRMSRVGDDLQMMSCVHLMSDEELSTHRASNIIQSCGIKNNDVSHSVSEGAERYIDTDKNLFCGLIKRIDDIIVLQGGRSATFTVEGGSIIVETDADSLDCDKYDGLFDIGHSSPSPELGSTPPVMYEICKLHSWDIEIDSKDGYLWMEILLDQQ